jgi:hypothetical protein
MFIEMQTAGAARNGFSTEANGYVVDHVETNMSAVKQDLGVVPRLSSCHTAVKWKVC